jgi:agmatinase
MSATFDPSGPATFDGIFGLPHTPDEAEVVLVPVPWEPTTSYRKGTARGPAAIKRASRQVDLFDPKLGRIYERGLAMLPEDEAIVRWNAEAVPLAEAVLEALEEGREGELEGALTRVNELSVALDARVYELSRRWLEAGKVVGVVGGDHASPFGAMRASAERWPGLGVLHVDAHADLRQAYEGFARSHASIMFNVQAELAGVSKLVQVGIRDLCEDEHRLIEGSGGRIVTCFEHERAARMLEGESFAAVMRPFVEALPELVYVSFDVDGLDPSLCPSTGTPVPGGLSFHEATWLLEAVTKSGRTLVGFDLTEVAPGPEGDEWDANVGARLLYKLAGLARRPA